MKKKIATFRMPNGIMVKADAVEYSTGQLDAVCRAFFLSSGIDIGKARQTVTGVEVKFQNRIYHGFGYYNANKGLEVVSRELGCISLPTAGITILPAEKRRGRGSCCLFSNILDFLAFQNILTDWDNPIRDMLLTARKCDCIILNSAENFISLMLESDRYEKVNCMFPNDTYGRTLWKTLSGRGHSEYIDMSDFYNISLFGYNKEWSENARKDNGCRTETSQLLRNGRNCVPNIRIMEGLTTAAAVI